MILVFIDNYNLDYTTQLLSSTIWENNLGQLSVTFLNNYIRHLSTISSVILDKCKDNYDTATTQQFVLTPVQFNLVDPLHMVGPNIVTDSSAVVQCCH